MLDQASRLVLDVVLTCGPGAQGALARRLFLEKRRGESMPHVAMKLCAWCLYAAHGGADADLLQIEVPVDQHYRPDVVRLDAATRRPSLWIDCGRTAPKKLEEVVRKNRGAAIVIVKATHGELAAYRAGALPRLRRLPFVHGVRWLGFDEGFVASLASRLWGRHALTVALDAPGEAGRALAVAVDGALAETTVGWLPSDDEPPNVEGDVPTRGTHGRRRR